MSRYITVTLFNLSHLDSSCHDSIKSFDTSTAKDSRTHGSFAENQRGKRITKKKLLWIGASLLCTAVANATSEHERSSNEGSQGEASASPTDGAVINFKSNASQSAQHYDRMTHSHIESQPCQPHSIKSADQDTNSSAVDAPHSTNSHQIILHRNKQKHKLPHVEALNKRDLFTSNSLNLSSNRQPSPCSPNFAATNHLKA